MHCSWNRRLRQQKSLYQAQNGIQQRGNSLFMRSRRGTDNILTFLFSVQPISLTACTAPFRLLFGIVMWSVYIFVCSSVFSDSFLCFCFCKHVFSIREWESCNIPVNQRWWPAMLKIQKQHPSNHLELSSNLYTHLSFVYTSQINSLAASWTYLNNHFSMSSNHLYHLHSNHPNNLGSALQNPGNHLNKLTTT